MIIQNFSNVKTKETFIKVSAFERMRIEGNCGTDAYKAGLTIAIADPSMDTILLRQRLIFMPRDDSPKGHTASTQ